MADRESLCAFPDPVATVLACDKAGCPLTWSDKCARDGCPGNRPEWDGAAPEPVRRGRQRRSRAGWTCCRTTRFSTEDFDTAWLSHSTHRAEATRRYADEMGCKFSEVRCSVEWLRCIDKYEDGRKINGWADEMWFKCSPDDPGAYKFWRLELR
jgi:hypothetical protein